MDKKYKNPALRFKGFTEDWIEINFNNTFKSLSNNTLSRADLNYESGLAKNIHYGDVLIKYKEILDVQSNEIPFISNNELVDKFRTSKLQDGDVIFADAAEDETVGKCTEIINVNNEVVYPGLHTIAVRPTFFFASKYLGYYLNSPAYHNQLLRLMQGTKVSSISKSAIKDTVIIHPKDTTEQKQIGTFFQNLDNLITLHQKKYDKLVILKKAMLVKMFPKKGALVPEIRFKGFTADWIEKKVSDLFQVTRGNVLAATETSFKPTKTMQYPVYSSQTKNNGLMGYYKDYLFENAITWTTDGANAGTVNYRPGKFYSTNVNGVLISNEGYANKSIAEIINLVAWKYVSHVGNPKLMNNVMSEIKIFIPNLIKEQNLISNFFEDIDNQIALHKKQLDKLNNIKKACFSKMFVAQD